MPHKRGYVDTRSARHFYGRSIPRPVYKHLAARRSFDRAAVNKRAALKKLFTYKPMCEHCKTKSKGPVLFYSRGKPMYAKDVR